MEDVSFADYRKHISVYRFETKVINWSKEIHLNDKLLVIGYLRKYASIQQNIYIPSGIINFCIVYLFLCSENDLYIHMNSDNTKQSKHSLSVTARAGIIFPVGRIARQMRLRLPSLRIGSLSPIYLSAVLEYLMAELFDICGNAAMQNEQQRIDPKDIMSAVQRDNEFKSLNMFDISKLFPGCYSDNINEQIESAKHIRIILSLLTHPPVQYIIDSGIIPRFLQLCQNHQFPQLQYESLWVLADIACGPEEFIQCLIKGHNIFINFLKHPSYEICEHVLYVLGNIANNGGEFNDLLLQNENILPNILEICQLPFDKQSVTNFNNLKKLNNEKAFIKQHINVLKITSWTIRNLCCGTMKYIKQLKYIIKSLKYLFQHALAITDKDQKDEIIDNIAWSFCYLTIFDDNPVNAGPIINKMEQLKIIENVLTVPSDVQQRKECLTFAVLLEYFRILKSSELRPFEVKERNNICQSITNICLGSIGHKLLVLESNVCEILINYLNYKSYNCAHEALLAIRNLLTANDERIIQPLIDYGVLNTLFTFLTTNFSVIKYDILCCAIKDMTLLTTLQCIENIITGSNIHLCANEMNVYVISMEQYAEIIVWIRVYNEQNRKRLVFGYVKRAETEYKLSQHISMEILQTVLSFVLLKI